MTRSGSVRDDLPEEPATGVGRFELRVVLGLLALVVGAVPFLGLLLLVQREWRPLRELDDAVAADLNELVSSSPGLVDVLRVVTDLGGTPEAAYVFVLTAAWLWIRRQRRLAAYVASTGAGLIALVHGTKALVGRARPDVALPVVELPVSASFPSGHAMVSLVTWTVLALVVLPAVPRRARALLLALAAVVTTAVGFTRLALGVHFVSDVLAGWALGVGWLAVTTAAFRGWQHEHGTTTTPLWRGLDPAAEPALHLAPAPEPALPRGGATLKRLTAAAAAIVLGMSALGLLVTGPLADGALGRLDAALMRAVVDRGAQVGTDVAQAAAALSGGRVLLAVALAQALLVLAVTARRRPAVFVAVGVVGAVLLSACTALVVARVRPDAPEFPVGTSWPSVHAAAAVGVFGVLAVLVVVHATSRWRWAVLVAALVVPLLAGVARIAVDVQSPTDVVAGLTVGALWVLACTRILLRAD